MNAAAKSALRSKLGEDEVLRRKVMPYAILAGILALIIGVSEATPERPQAYAGNFCLVEQGNRSCGFRNLSECLQKMNAPDADCVRELKAVDDRKVAAAVR